MNQIWAYTLVSVLFVSAVSLVGIATIPINVNRLKKILLLLVGLSTGALFGDAFLHLLPEIVEERGFGLGTSLLLVSGIVLFFVLEKIVYWRHCHVPTSEDHLHPLAFMNLVGDGLHNFIDGMLIGGSYLMSVQLGVTTTIAVVLHEIPQEIGDFGVLLYAGLSKRIALLFNFLAALLAVLGALVTLIIGARVEGFAPLLIPLTAGGFIYIAGSDLIPELKKEESVQKSLLQLISIILGIAVMLILLLLE